MKNRDIYSPYEGNKLPTSFVTELRNSPPEKVYDIIAVIKISTALVQREYGTSVDHTSFATLRSFLDEVKRPYQLDMGPGVIVTSADSEEILKLCEDDSIIKVTENLNKRKEQKS